jgi:hypothetical protein
MKSSEKLKAYKQSQADYNDASAVIDGIRKQSSEIRDISVSSNLVIDRASTERQFLFALGILSQQITSCPLLNLPDAEYIEKRDKITALWKLMQEEKAWVQYASELRRYTYELEDLLDSDDKFQLLEYPKKK